MRILGILALMMATTAYAGGDYLSPEQEQTQLQGQAQGQAQGQVQGQHAHGGDARAHSKAGAHAGAVSGSYSGSRANAAQLQGQALDNEIDLQRVGNSKSKSSANSDQSNEIDLSDNSTNSYSYVEEEKYRAPYMSSNTLLMNSAPCKTFIGLQFSGANNGEAGGVGLGWPVNDRDCKLEKSTRLAFASGNPGLAWRLFCSQDNVLKPLKRQMRLAGVKPRAERERRAYTQCVSSGLETVANDSLQK